MDGGGVACDDDGACAHGDELFGDSEATRLDLLCGFVAVGAPRGVADVVDGRLREFFPDFKQHGKPPDSRVEDADGVV